MLVAFGGGWVAARQFQSPAQREAAARPPSAGPLFAVVEQGVLSERVSGSGSITYQRVDAIAVSRGGVVTARPLIAGRTIRAGGVLTEIESRPVFVFAGRFVFYRDLSSGDRGADVTQLQAGLRASGHAIPAAETGTFGPATAAAVKALFAAAGYPAPNGFPLADLAVARDLPATVFKVPAVGMRLDDGGTVATVAQGHLVARVSLDAAASIRIEKGQQAEVTVNNENRLTGRVATLPATTAHSDPQVTIAFTATPSKELAGRAAVAIITVKAVPRAGLIVPTRAVADGPDGTAHVILKTGTERRSVTVHILGSLNGRSVIEPADSSVTLHPGDLVQVG